MDEFTSFELQILADGRVLSVIFNIPGKVDDAAVDSLIHRILAAFASLAEQDEPGTGRLIERSISITHDPHRRTICLRYLYQTANYPERFEKELKSQSARVLH